MLDRTKFISRASSKISSGTVFNNPGGGTSVIKWIDAERICYMRGHSRFYISLSSLFDVYEKFAGQRVSTTELKAYDPGIFDSKNKGHNCNCTFLFLLFLKMELATAIQGKGRSGDPFSIKIINYRE